MTPAGFESIEIAKKNRIWSALDGVDELIVPHDLRLLLENDKTAFDNWEQFSRSAKWEFYSGY
jgi:uncharacterized protein YdeI (YjbR/CyaY-like superfamily)